MINREIFESKLLNERYEKITHSSGLDVYVFPKKLTTTYALFGVNYGSVNNRFYIGDSEELITVPYGIAHFLEHKLFTNEDGSDSFERFSEYGADANAYTAFNKTAYLFSCTDRFAESLTELVRFVTHPYFTPESVASEIGIIAEEIRMYDDSPSERCYYGLLEGMYEKHNIRQNICGSEESISQISADTLYQCYNAFYRLDNMALVICGNVSTDEILEVLDKELAQNTERLCVRKVDESAEEHRTAYKSYVEQRMQVSKPIFNIGFKDTDIPHTPTERQRKDAIMTILDEMIFSSAGDLYQYLFENDLISPHLSFGYSCSSDAAYNSIGGYADDPKRVLNELLAHIEKLKANGLSYEDFLRGKRVSYAEFVKSFDSTDNIANNLLSFVFDGYEMLSYPELINSITFEDVNNVFQTAFDPDTVTLSVVLPLDDKDNIKE